MKNFFKEYKWFFIAVFIFSTSIVYGLIALPFPPSLGDTKDGWLNYFGSFLGGLFGGITTIYALVKTLNHSKEVEEENKRLSILPYIKVEMRFELDAVAKKTYYYFIFKNVGLGTIIQMTIDYEIEAMEKIVSEQLHNFKCQYILGVNEELKLNFSCFEPKPDDTVETFDITYWDVTGKHKYEQSIELLFRYKGVSVNSVSEIKLKNTKKLPV